MVRRPFWRVARFACSRWPRAEPRALEGRAKTLKCGLWLYAFRILAIFGTIRARTDLTVPPDASFHSVNALFLRSARAILGIRARIKYLRRNSFNLAPVFVACLSCREKSPARVNFHCGIWNWSSLERSLEFLEKKCVAVEFIKAILFDLLLLWKIFFLYSCCFNYFLRKAHVRFSTSIFYLLDIPWDPF